MQLGPHRTSSTGNTGIVFPRLECWHPTSKVATIAANVNKKRVLCRISLETLKLKFGASEKNPMHSLAQHRMEIQDAARKLIENDIYQDDGSIVIHPSDL